MEKDETMEAIPFHTDAERVSAAFQRNDNLNSNLYEIAKRFLFGYVLLATPLRFFFVFAGSFYFYLWLITWQWLYRIGIVSYLVHQKMIQMAGRQGLRFVMLLIGVYWIDRHQISVEDMRRIVRTVRRQTNTECPEDDYEDQQQQNSQRYYCIEYNFATHVNLLCLFTLDMKMMGSNIRHKMVIRVATG